MGKMKSQPRRPIGGLGMVGMKRVPPPVKMAVGGGVTDYRLGGPVAGGPLGRDTVPAVSPKGGPTKAMLDNGEYVLPKPTVAAVGKPALDGLVVGTTGQPPVGYGQPMPGEPQGYKCGGKMKYASGGLIDPAGAYNMPGILMSGADMLTKQAEAAAAQKQQDYVARNPFREAPGTFGEVKGAFGVPKGMFSSAPMLESFAQGGSPVVDPKEEERRRMVLAQRPVATPMLPSGYGSAPPVPDTARSGYAPDVVVPQRIPANAVTDQMPTRQGTHPTFTEAAQSAWRGQGLLSNGDPAPNPSPVAPVTGQGADRFVDNAYALTESGVRGVRGGINAVAAAARPVIPVVRQGAESLGNALSSPDPVGFGRLGNVLTKLGGQTPERETIKTPPPRPQMPRGGVQTYGQSMPEARMAAPTTYAAMPDAPRSPKVPPVSQAAAPKAPDAPGGGLPDPDRAGAIAARNAAMANRRGLPKSAYELGTALREGATQMFGPAVEGVGSAVGAAAMAPVNFGKGLVGMERPPATEIQSDQGRRELRDRGLARQPSAAPTAPGAAQSGMVRITPPGAPATAEGLNYVRNGEYPSFSVKTENGVQVIRGKPAGTKDNELTRDLMKLNYQAQLGMASEASKRQGSAQERLVKAVSDLIPATDGDATARTTAANLSNHFAPYFGGDPVAALSFAAPYAARMPTMEQIVAEPEIAAMPPGPPRDKLIQARWINLNTELINAMNADIRMARQPLQP